MKLHFNNSRFVLISLLITVAGFSASTYSKYDLNDLSLTGYRIDYIGNILNILISLFLVAGFILLGFKNKILEKKRMTFITTLLILMIICIFIPYCLTKFNIFGNEGYILNIPVKKAYTGLLLVLSIFISVYVLIYVWGIVLGFEKLFELRTLFRSLSAFILLFIFTLFFVWNVNSYSESKIGGRKFKYGFVPGAAVYSKGKPSPIFEARIRKSFELHRNGIIEKIVLTGSNAPGEITEAEAAYRYLINLGIKPDQIIIENKTSTTSEQVKYLKLNLPAKKDLNEILIISDGFHLTRVLQICKFFKLDAVGVSSDYSLSFEKTLFYRTRESIALLLFWFFAI